MILINGVEIKTIEDNFTFSGAKDIVTRSLDFNFIYNPLREDIPKYNVAINDKVELLDTPGIIPTVQDDQFQALKLACVNSIGENAYDSEYVANELLKILSIKYKEEIQKIIDTHKKGNKLSGENYTNGHINRPV